MDVIQEIEDAVDALLSIDELSERKAAAVRRRYADAIAAAREHVEHLDEQLTDARMFPDG